MLCNPTNPLAPASASLCTCLRCVFLFSQVPFAQSATGAPGTIIPPPFDFISRLPHHPSALASLPPSIARHLGLASSELPSRVFSFDCEHPSSCMASLSRLPDHWHLLSLLPALSPATLFPPCHSSLVLPHLQQLPSPGTSPPKQPYAHKPTCPPRLAHASPLDTALCLFFTAHPPHPCPAFVAAAGRQPHAAALPMPSPAGLPFAACMACHPSLVSYVLSGKEEKSATHREFYSMRLCDNATPV